MGSWSVCEQPLDIRPVNRLCEDMFIKYFIPEDGDEQAHPNVFRLEASQPTLSEIKKAFPVPGTYHFRFLKNVGSHIVWLDVTDDSNALPMFQGSIFIKVSRVSAPSAPSSSFSSGPVPVSTAPQAAASAPAVAAPTGGISPPAKAPKPDMGRRNSEKLISFEEVASPVSPSTAGADVFAASSAPILVAAPAPPASDNDLLGIASSAPDSSSQKSAAPSSDFFGLEALKPTPQGVMSGGGSGHTTRSMSPMGGGGLNPMAGGMGMNPMTGSVGNGMNTMGGGMGGMGGQPAMGGRGGMGMGGMGMGAPPPRPMGGGAAYDPFSTIGSMQGGRGAGPMGGRR